MALRLAKKKEPEHPLPLRRDENDYSHAGTQHDEGNWLVSYADMMTLLCCFFILLFSMSKLDAPQYEVVRKEVSQQFHGRYEAPPVQGLAKEMTQIVEDAGVSKQAVIKADALSVTVAFESTLFFDRMSAEIRPEGRVLLERLIGKVAERQLTEGRFFRIAVEGHTDCQPIVGGDFPSNWELSGARASRVVRLFAEKGFTPSLLTAIAYGDTRPELPSRRADGTWDEEALARNRRVVLRIMDPRLDAIPLNEEAYGPPAP